MNIQIANYALSISYNSNSYVQISHLDESVPEVDLH